MDHQNDEAAGPVATRDEPVRELATHEPRRWLRAVFFGDDGLRAGWALALWLVVLAVGLVLVQAVVGNLGRAHTAGSAVPQRVFTLRSVLLNEWLDSMAVAAATLVMCRVERRRFANFGFMPRRWLRNFLTGFGWGVALLSALVLLLRAQGLLIFDGRVLFAGAAVRYGALWLLAFLAVGWFEETFFRGYFLLTLARGLSGIYRYFGLSAADALGFWTSAVLLSFGFGFVHSSNPGESPIGLFAAGVAGLVFCLSLWRTGSLWWAIGFHATWDWAESYLYGVADSGNMAEGHLFATHPHGSALLSGGLTGPEGSIWVLPVLLVAAILIVLTLPKGPHPWADAATTSSM